jgi:hypothetical protein
MRTLFIRLMSWIILLSPANLHAFFRLHIRFYAAHTLQSKPSHHMLKLST